MSLELILFWVIAFVLILDFILRGLKKKKTEKKIQNLLSDPKKEFTRNNLIYFKISISIIASFIISFSYNSIVFDGIIGAVKKGYTDNLNNALLSQNLSSGHLDEPFRRTQLLPRIAWGAG